MPWYLLFLCSYFLRVFFNTVMWYQVFLSNTNNLLTVVRFQGFLSNSNNYMIVGVCSQGRPEGSHFNSYYTKVSGRALLLSLDCSTLPSIHTLYCWLLSKEVSSTILKVFGMMWPGIEPRSTGPLANTLPTGCLTIQCNFVSYSEQPFLFFRRGILSLCRGFSTF